MDGGGQAAAVEFLTERSGDQSGGEELAYAVGGGVGQDHLAVVADIGLVLVQELVERRVLLDRDVLRQVQDGVEGVLGMVGVALCFGELLDVEPLVQQEVEVAAGDRVGHENSPREDLASTKRSLIK